MYKVIPSIFLIHLYTPQPDCAPNARRPQILPPLSRLPPPPQQVSQRPCQRRNKRRHLGRQGRRPPRFPPSVEPSAPPRTRTRRPPPTEPRPRQRPSTLRVISQHGTVASSPSITPTAAAPEARQSKATQATHEEESVANGPSWSI